MTGTIYSRTRGARPRRRAASATLVAALALGTLAVVWTGRNWPPPLWILQYGLPGSQGPTGRVARIEGIEFVEISPGYFRMGSDWRLDRGDTRFSAGDVMGRLGVEAGLPWGRTPFYSEEMPLHWIELPHGFFIARTEITDATQS